MIQPLWIKIIVIILLIGLGYLSDKSTKMLATAHFKNKPPVEIIKNHLHLTYTENSSGVFSVLDSIDKNVRLPLLYCLFSITFIIVGFMLFFAMRKRNIILAISFAFILGGGLGNFLDLVFDGYVVDFIDVHYMEKFHWPTFNVADILIVIGMILILISNFFLFRTRDHDTLEAVRKLSAGVLPLAENRYNYFQHVTNKNN